MLYYYISPVPRGTGDFFLQIPRGARGRGIFFTKSPGVPGAGGFFSTAGDAISRPTKYYSKQTLAKFVQWFLKNCEIYRVPHRFLQYHSTVHNTMVL